MGSLDILTHQKNSICDIISGNCMHLDVQNLLDFQLTLWFFSRFFLLWVLLLLFKITSCSTVWMDRTLKGKDIFSVIPRPSICSVDFCSSDRTVCLLGMNFRTDFLRMSRWFELLNPSIFFVKNHPEKNKQNCPAGSSSNSSIPMHGLWNSFLPPERYRQIWLPTG